MRGVDCHEQVFCIGNELVVSQGEQFNHNQSVQELEPADVFCLLKKLHYVHSNLLALCFQVCRLVVLKDPGMLEGLSSGHSHV